MDATESDARDDSTALAAAMTTRLFSDLIECDAEAVIP